MTATVTPPNTVATPSLAESALPRAGSNTISTLPEPMQTDGMQDMVAKLYATMSALENVQSKTSASDVKANQAKQNEASRQHQEQLDKAKKAQEGGGFFHWLGSGMGATGLVALATGNPTLLIASIVMHKTNMMKNTKFDVLDGAMICAGPVPLAADLLIRKVAAPDLGKGIPGISDKDVKPVVDKVAMATVALAGAALSVVTAGTTAALVVACIGLALSAGSIACEFAGGPKELSMAFSIGSAALTLGAGLANGIAAVSTAAGETAATGGSAAASTGAEAAKAGVDQTENAVKLVKATGDGMQGADTVVNTIHQHTAGIATEHAAEFKNLLTKLERLLDAVIDGAKASKESYQRTTTTLRGIVQTNNDTLTMSANAIRG